MFKFQSHYKFGVMDIRSKWKMAYIKIMIKSLVIMCWSGALVFLASIAFSGQASSILDSASREFGKWVDPPLTSERVELDGTAVGYLYDFDPVTSFHTLLSTLNKVIPTWIDANVIAHDTHMTEEMRKAYYYALFDAIDEHFIAVVQDKSIDPTKDTISRDILPKPFHDLMSQDQVTLPELAVNYVKQQRLKNDSLDLKVKLVNDFFIMLVLGAFGSLVFLLKGFLKAETDQSLIAYFVRPLLGMFLAMAVFLIDMLTHSVISNSGIEMMRVEPLYILGFAAGLLSEQVYTLVLQQLENVIEKSKSSENNSSATTAPDDKSPDKDTQQISH